jgi:TRAP-type C4-dicarboxylate transport system permease small subunit
MGRITSAFHSCVNFWYRLTSTICAAIVVFAMLMITAEIILRVTMNKSIQPVMQFSGYSLFVITMLGAAWVLREKSHISVTFLVDKFSKRVRTILNVILKLLGSVTCIFLMYVTGNYIINEVWATRMLTDYPIRFPLAYLMIIMPVGWLFLAIEFLIQLGPEISNVRKGDSDADEALPTM